MKAKGNSSVGIIILVVLFLGTVVVAGIANLRTLRGSQQNSLATTNPTPPVLAANAPSKEYVYSGSSLIATVEPTPSIPADIAIWRPSNGLWCIMGQAGSAQSFEAWGIVTDKPMPGDYDGDGKTDLAIYRALTGYWWIYYSGTETVDSLSWGDQTNDIPVVADFDGDGRSDPTIVRWDSGNSVYVWWVLLSTGGYTTYNWGTTGDKPGPADYDGDGKGDVGMYRPGNDQFWWYGSGDGQSHDVTLNDGDQPVSSDYDGDGKADPAIYDKDTAYWYIHQSTTNSLASLQWGTANDQPVQNDYDGDGKTDLATFTSLSNDSVWTIKRSSNGTTRTEYWGATGDIPVPAFYRR